MATKNKMNMSQRLINNGQGKSGLISKTPLFTETPIKENKTEKSENNNNNKEDTTTIVKEDKTIDKVQQIAKKYTTTSEDDEINFQSYINSSFKLNSSSDNQDIKYEIEVSILKAINSIQTDYKRDQSGKTVVVKYFDDKDNSKIFKNVIEKFMKLVNSLDLSIEEKNDYFTRLMDDFIRQRFTYIIKIGLEEMFTPKDIEHALRTFLEPGKDYFDDELLDEYLNYYIKLSQDFIYSRVERNTFYVNELLNEVLNIIRKDTKSDVSILFNELVLSNIDQKYIDLAKKNIYDRKPFNSQFTKYQKKTLKEHGII